MVIRFDNNHIVTIKDILMSVSTSTKFKHVSYLWDEAKYHAPYAVHFRMAILAWNAVTTKINAGGQVEGTCVGTGMAFDPAFYYYRPVNVYAGHGYGPVLLAGAEIINLLKSNQFEINDRVSPTEKIVNRHELIRKIRGATRLQANGDSKVFRFGIVDHAYLLT
jgi:hypothetical protein